MTRILLSLMVCLAGLLVAGCSFEDEEPENPTFRNDVHLILRANCVRCHDDHSREDAPDDFRLDVYNDEEPDPDDSDSGDLGAFSMASDIVDEAVEKEEMPPDGPPLTDRQKQILVRWVEAGAPY